MMRKIALAFVAIQVVGEVLVWAAAHFERSGVWVVSVVLLFPGDLVGSWFIERLLWTSGARLWQFEVAKLVLELATNAAVWGTAVLLLQKVFAAQSPLVRSPDSSK